LYGVGFTVGFTTMFVYALGVYTPSLLCFQAFQGKGKGVTHVKPKYAGCTAGCLAERVLASAACN
jgi:hypothetical protein